MPFEMFAALTLLIVCTINPALKNPFFKMIAASPLQKVWSIYPAKQNPPFKKIATSTTPQNICSLHPAKYLQPAPSKMLAASIPAMLSKLPNEGANEAAMWLQTGCKQAANRLQTGCKQEQSSQKFLDPNYTSRYPRLKK